MPDNECKWKLRLDIRHGCNEPPLPGDPDSYCILHSKKEDKDINNQFKEKVKERIEKGRLTSAGYETDRVDLRGCYFPKNFSSEYFRIVHIFNKPVYLAEAAFSGMTSFFGVKFSQEVEFTGATFSQNTNFSRAIFCKKVCFSRAEFSVVDFSGTAFKGEVRFIRTEFKERASFLPHGIPEKDARKVDFSGPGLFQYTRFTGEVIFQDVNLSQCSFLHSNIDRVDFRYCEFAKKGRRKNVLKDELECDEEVKNKKKTREEGYEPVRRVYLELKRNFEEKKDWNTAGDFHFGEMECRRQKMPCWKRYFWSLEFWYWLTSGYCERPLRAFIVLLCLVGVFSLLYMPTEEWNYFTSLRDSLNVAKLMRLGNSMGQDPGWGKFIVALFEIILVPIQTTLLALALRRKVKR